MGQVIQSFQKRGHGFVNLKAGMIPRTLLGDWGDFVTSPGDEKKYFVIPNQVEPDHGYVKRIGEVRPKEEWDDPDIPKLYDPKDFFHWSPQIMQDIVLQNSQNQGFGRVFKKHHRMMSRCGGLYKICFEKCLEVGREIELAYGTPVVEGIWEGHSLGLHKLRLLYYLCADTGQEPAAQHLDKDFLTIQVIETNPGFYYIDPRTGLRVSYTSRPGKNLIFPGRKAQMICGLLPLPHGVQEEVALSSGCIRMSIVFFCHTPHIL